MSQEKVAMHGSRLAGFIIDCQTDDLDAAASSWSQALGYQTKRSADSAEANYVALDSSRADLVIEVQKVDHSSRAHVDIEADDIEAELARLETLGAKRIQQTRTWCVMEAPTGQRFCVIKPQESGFAAKANQWE